jgi:hypothetical protein
MLLLLAYDRRNPDLLHYLLNEGFRFWPSKKSLEKLLNERLFEEITRYVVESALLEEGEGQRNPKQQQ